MGRTIIEDQSNRLHSTTVGFCDNNRLQKRAEIDEAFARVALTIDQPISDTQSCHQVECSLSLIAWGLIHRMPLDGWRGACSASRAWKKVFSSVQTTQIPCSSKAAACSYKRRTGRARCRKVSGS